MNQWSVSSRHPAIFSLCAIWISSARFSLVYWKWDIASGHRWVPSAIVSTSLLMVQVIVVSRLSVMEINTTDRSVGLMTCRGGLGCLNRFSASISGASAGVRLPSGAAAG